MAGAVHVLLGAGDVDEVDAVVAAEGAILHGRYYLAAVAGPFYDVIYPLCTNL